MRKKHQGKHPTPRGTSTIDFACSGASVVGPQVGPTSHSHCCSTFFMGFRLGAYEYPQPPVNCRPSFRGFRTHASRDLAAAVCSGLGALCTRLEHTSVGVAEGGFGLCSRTRAPRGLGWGLLGFGFTVHAWCRIWVWGLGLAFRLEFRV